MTGPAGEMPFLDHLEELRWRILRSLVAVVVGFGLGLWLVQHFQLVNLLKQPIAPYLTGAGGKLIVTSPTDPVMTQAHPLRPIVASAATMEMTAYRRSRARSATYPAASGSMRSTSAIVCGALPSARLFTSR